MNYIARCCQVCMYKCALKAKSMSFIFHSTSMAVVLPPPPLRTIPLLLRTATS